MDPKVFTSEDTQNAMQSLEKSGITEHFVTRSRHAPVPEVLNYSLKLAYQAAGLADNAYHLTDLGRTFFDQIEDAKKAGIVDNSPDLPRVASFNID